MPALPNPRPKKQGVGLTVGFHKPAVQFTFVFSIVLAQGLCFVDEFHTVRMSGESKFF